MILANGVSFDEIRAFHDKTMHKNRSILYCIVNVICLVYIYEYQYIYNLETESKSRNKITIRNPVTGKFLLISKYKCTNKKGEKE